MAFRVVRKGCVPDMLPAEDHRYESYGYHGFNHTKRRGSGGSLDHEEPDYGHAKRARREQGPYRTTDINHRQQHHHHLHHHQHHHSHACADNRMPMTSINKATTVNPPFIVIREHSSSPELDPHTHQHEPQLQGLLSNFHVPSSITMERTASGHSISSSDSPPPDEPPSLLSDLAAANLVHNHLANVNRHARHARILRALVYPKTPSSSRDFTIDDDALESIFSAANDLFFANKLRGRVTWDWSHPETSAPGRYDYAIVGTTALRKRRGHRGGGYETLIVLSSPILRDTKYNRRLLISTFLHEMIHSFLFVMCGRKAGIDGGHTEGFRRIAADIDGWIGRECLRLSDMEADLERFTVDEQCQLDTHAPSNGRGDSVVFTDLNDHLQSHQHQTHSYHHRDKYDQTQHYHLDVNRSSSGGVAAAHYDEMETSPHYPCAAAAKSSHFAHTPYHESGEWQWQRREGFGASHGHAY